VRDLPNDEMDVSLDHHFKPASHGRAKATTSLPLREVLEGANELEMSYRGADTIEHPPNDSYSWIVLTADTRQCVPRPPTGDRSRLYACQVDWVSEKPSFTKRKPTPMEHLVAAAKLDRHPPERVRSQKGKRCLTKRLVF
jgi:hypothetical protein